MRLEKFYNPCSTPVSDDVEYDCEVAAVWSLHFISELPRMKYLELFNVDWSHSLPESPFTHVRPRPVLSSDSLRSLRIHGFRTRCVIEYLALLAGCEIESVAIPVTESMSALLRTLDMNVPGLKRVEFFGRVSTYSTF